MKKVRWVSATAGAAMIAATLALPGAGVAYASESGGVTGNGNASLLSGNSAASAAPASSPRPPAVTRATATSPAMATSGSARATPSRCRSARR